MGPSDRRRAGRALSGMLVYRFAPEAEGHGTDAAIAAVHHDPSGIRARSVLVKLVASALTIGSGGSAGREGPTAQISAGFGSMLARILHLSPSDARIAVSTGIGSGIGAIFKAPLGGAVLASEILYRNDMEPEALIPAFVASGVSYVVYGFADGFTPIFLTAGTSSSQTQCSWCGFRSSGLPVAWWGCCMPAASTASTRGSPACVFRACCALPRRRVCRVHRAVSARSARHRLRVDPGCLHPPSTAERAPCRRAVLPFARILATGLSIGSGGSGGIFGPGLVIGGFVGAAVWRVLEPFAPWIPHSPTIFVIVGMMACFGSISRAPLAVMLLVASMTASFDAIPPAMLAVGIATLIVQRSDATIYRSQFGSRKDLPEPQTADPPPGAEPLERG